MLVAGSLQDLLASDDKGNPRGLNVLDIPMGEAPIPPTSGYLHLASNAKAWQATRGLPSITKLPFLSDETQWGTAATAGATTWHHIDDCGLGTMVQNVAGRKYWVIARPKATSQTSEGKMHSRKAFTKWEASHPGDEIWDFEGVVLEPGDTL